MKTNDDLVPVNEFIAESERNLEIATVIHDQYESAREKILKEFLGRLTDDWKSKKPGWSCRYTLPFFTARYGAFDLFKKAWAGRYTIRLEAFDWGDGMVYGVWRDASALPGPPNAALLTALREKLPQATSRSWYEAEIIMSSPAKDWRTPNALWRIHSDKTFLAEVEASLLEIAELAETYIDAMAATGRPSTKK